MPRKPRQEVAGGVFHVYARGNDKRDIYLQPSDHRRYLSMLGGEAEKRRWNLLAYCLMPNHVHLLIATPVPNLAPGLQRAHSLYAQDFNQRHGRSGHLFQGRYGAVPIGDDVQLITVIRYIARNPVAAGLVETPSEWIWSSHRATRGEVPAPDWLATERLLDLLRGWSHDPRGAYAALTAA